MQFTFLLDDVGIPKNYRTMDGFGVHTYKLINRAGKETYVKFHWKTKQGACLQALFTVLCCAAHTHRKRCPSCLVMLRSAAAADHCHIS
jgi:Catalase